MKKAIVSVISSSVLLAGLASPAFASTYNFGGINIHGNGNNTNINITDNSKNYNYTTNITFNDLGGVNWAKSAIADMVKKGIINGMDKKHYAPDKKLTRAQFAVLVTKEFHLQTSDTTTQDFADVPPTLQNGKANWSFKYIEAVKDYFDATTNLSGGYNFNPSDPIRREDAAVTLVKILTKAGSIQMDSADQIQQVLSDYSDVDSVPSALQPYIATAITNNLMKGEGNGNFASERALTRAEAAVLLDRLQTQTIVVPSDSSGVVPTTPVDTTSTNNSTTSTEVAPTTSDTTTSTTQTSTDTGTSQTGSTTDTQTSTSGATTVTGDTYSQPSN